GAFAMLEELERDRAARLLVAGTIHGAHPPGARVRHDDEAAPYERAGREEVGQGEDPRVCLLREGVPRPLERSGGGAGRSTHRSELPRAEPGDHAGTHTALRDVLFQPRERRLVELAFGELDQLRIRRAWPWARARHLPQRKGTPGRREPQEKSCDRQR